MTTWLIENSIFDTEEELKKVINSLGQKYITFDYIPIICDIKKLSSVDDNVVIFRGSLNAARIIQRNYNFNPGVIGHFSNYDCVNYYPYFKKYLLNSEYDLYEYDLLRIKTIRDSLYKKYGIDATIFIRPTSGMKPFTGSLVSKDEYYDKITNEFLLYGDIEPNSLCLISSPVNIKKEWRFVVVKNNIISGSEYHSFGKHNEKASYDNEAYEFLEEVIKDVKWRPDNIWVADVCKTVNGNFYLLEINSFSCSGFYKNDLKTIVEKVSEFYVNDDFCQLNVKNC